MAYYDTTWYCNSVGYAAVTARPQNTAVTAGQIVKQFTAPAVGSERCWICYVAGTTANTTDATWGSGTRGSKITDGTASWQECTGASAVNGDLTNTPNWTAAKAIGTPSLGAIIKRNSAASYQICTVAGTMAASEPSFSDTAGVTTSDGTSQWTCIGPVGNFTGGQAPFARIFSATASGWWIAGNTLYVGDNHAETQTSAMTINPTGSVSTVNKVICHNHSGSYPPGSGNLMTSATVSTATSAVSINIQSQGPIYFYGIAFQTNSNILIAGSAGAWLYFDACSHRIITTSSSGQIGLTTSNYNTVIFNNTTVSFAHTGQTINFQTVNFIWQNTGAVLYSGSLVPTAFLAHQGTTGNITSAVLEAIDLSQLTGSIYAQSAGAAIGTCLIKDCKLHASGTIATPLNTGLTIQTVRSDSGATGYKSARYQYEGTETTETTITRSGGAADPAGQAQSRKIVTTANVQWLKPYKAEPYAVWNATTGANVTVTVYGTGSALPNNDDIWLEVEYLGSSATPLGTIVTTTKASILASNAAVASDSSTWGGGTTPFKLTTTLSSPQPGMAGYIHARVRVGKASTTFYIDPQVYLS